MSDYETEWSDDIESLRTRLLALEQEMERRDFWIIGSIWGVVRGVASLSRTGLIVGVLIYKRWDAWWQLLIAALVASAWWWIAERRLAKLEDEDKAKIGRDSLMPGSWL